MDSIKISIITICYNSSLTIRKTIESVLKQNYSNIEYLIIDGKSTDDTLDIINEYKSDIIQVVSEPDNGISDAFNKGIKLAKGELIGLVNSDDQLEEGALRLIAETYKNNPADVIYGDTIIIDIKNNLKLFKKAGNPEGLKFAMPFIHQSCFIKKSVYKIFGGYKSEYKICMDYDLLARLYNSNCSFSYAGGVVSIFNYGGTSCEHPIKTINEDMKIARKYGLDKLSVFKYKVIHIPINLLKIMLSKIGLWKLLYKLLKKSQIIGYI